MKAKPIVLVTGNVGDGFTFYGPFPEVDDAIEFAEREKIDEWHIVELVTPA